MLHSGIISRWLEVPDSVRPMLDRSDANGGGGGGAGADHGAGGGGKGGVAAVGNGAHAGAGGDGADGAGDARNGGAQKSTEERKIMDLIAQLKPSQTNKVAAVKEFEEYFFDQRPRVAPEWIRILFQGEDGVSGLVATCGNVAYSQVYRARAYAGPLHAHPSDFLALQAQTRALLIEPVNSVAIPTFD